MPYMNLNSVAKVTMKPIKIALVVLIPSLLWADVTDSDSASKIPDGSTIAIEKQINIPPRTSAIYLMKGKDPQIQPPVYMLPSAYCMIEVYQNEKDDRWIMPSPQKFQLKYKGVTATEIQGGFLAMVTYSILESKDLDELTCVEIAKLPNMTIGEMKNHLERYFAIEIKKPIN